MPKIFIYGTLKKGECREECISGVFLGIRKTLPQYKLFNVGSYPALIEDRKEGISIEGELWAVNEECLKNLDLIEGHPHLYKRQPVSLYQTDDEDVLLTYIFQGDVDNLEEITHWPIKESK
jgi:gamma-glutamylcyclotransferase (GGCT)/AIG2-like uncharacterized protein YtfP